METAIHLGLLRARPDFGAVLHCHALHASMFAVARRPIPSLIDELSIGIDRTAQIVVGAEVLGGAVALPQDAYDVDTAVYEIKVKSEKGEEPT